MHFEKRLGDLWLEGLGLSLLMVAQHLLLNPFVFVVFWVFHPLQRLTQGPIIKRPAKQISRMERLKHPRWGFLLPFVGEEFLALGVKGGEFVGQKLFLQGREEGFDDVRVFLLEFFLLTGVDVFDDV